MDFFEYATAVEPLTTNTDRWVIYLVGGLCFAIVFVFQTVALYVISGHEGYKNRWMAFIPFFSTYYIGVCGQKNRFFKMDIKKIAIATAIFEAVLFTGYLVYTIASEMLLANGSLARVAETNIYGLETVRDVFTNVPASLAWAEWCRRYLWQYILTWLDLIYTFMNVMVLSCFFQTYAARRYFIFTITSVFFPIQGILFFIVRNNKGMNYYEFMRGEQERQYRAYRQYQGYPADDPYNRNPYSTGAPQNPPPPPQGQGVKTDDPFDEYPDSDGVNSNGSGTGNGSGGSGGNGGDPFDEFN